MKKNIGVIAAAILAAAALTACGTSKTAETSAAESSEAAEETTGDLEDLTVGASPAPHAEILEAAREELAKKGYNLKIVEYTDYVQPNLALEAGDLDANYFQHTPYLNNFNKENGTDLAAAFDMHYEPFGIYAGKTAAIEELKDGIDPTSDATKLDITENPKNLDIQEIGMRLARKSDKRIR